MKLLDVVELREDLPQLRLKAGLRGTIVEVYTVPDTAYEVEFTDESGITKAMLPLRAEQLNLVWAYPTPTSATAHLEASMHLLLQALVEKGILTLEQARAIQDAHSQAV